MSAPSVIPRPVSLRVRDFLQRGGPVLAISAAVLVVISLWTSSPIPSNFVGEIQSPTGTISSPEAGRLLEILVQPFEIVTNGQVLGRVSVASDDVLKANLAALRADLEVMRVRMLQDQERNDLNHAQVRTEYLLHRLELVGARIRLRQAESEFERNRQLYEQKILAAGVGVDQDGYEVALRDRDLLRAEVADKERLVGELEAALQTLRPPDRADRTAAIHNAISSAVAAQEESLRETEGPSTLRASINGMVTKIYRRPGENIAQAEPLFELRSTRPEWILGFIRQPISSEPKVGDTVEVRSRGRPLKTGIAKVLNVGGHLELFAQPLRVRGFDAAQERGLPVMLSFPDNLNLHPGELVDLIPTTDP